MGDVVQWPGEQSGDDGGGPEDPMLEQRVAQLEFHVADIKAMLQKIEAATNSGLAEVRELKSKDIVEVRTKLSFIEGRLHGMPSTWQLFAVVLTTWAAGAAIVFTLLRYTAQ